MAADPDAQRQALLWNRWSESVPHLYPDSDPSAIVEFLKGLADGGAALELGAGDGRVAVPLARAGVPVVGLEISSGLASQLRNAASGLDLEVVEADMAAFDLPRQFRIVYAVRSTFFHLGTQDRQITCLQISERHLTPGGRLILDCFVPDLHLLERGSEVTLDGYDDDAVELRACDVDPVEQRIVYREIRLASNAPTRILPVEQRFCWPSELDLMARYAGFELHSRTGDFCGAAFSAACHRHVSVYRRQADL
jgi:SAM-dependent methyltransferase